MKRLFVVLCILLSQYSFSQNDIDAILQIGVANAQRFSEDYFDAAGESLVNNMSNGWFSTAETKKLFHFEVGIVGNLSFVREEKQSFLLNVNDYENLTLNNAESNVIAYVPNAFGQNTTGVSVTVNQGEASEFELLLPDGLGSSETNMVPGGFIQGSMGLIKSTEIKLRFLPRLEVRDNTKIQLYGVAFQHEFTDWIFPLKRWPVRLAGLIGYTNVKGFYDLSADNGISGADQEVRINSNSWVINSIVSTKLKVLNFYGGVGYYFGSNDADLLGTYIVQNGPSSSEILTDPIKVRNKTNGIKATIGARVDYGVFKANLDYSLMNFQNITIGMQFGW